MKGLSESDIQYIHSLDAAVASRLIDEGNVDVLIDNLQDYSILNAEIGYQIMELGFEELVIENAEKFPGLDFRKILLQSIDKPHSWMINFQLLAEKLNCFDKEIFRVLLSHKMYEVLTTNPNKIPEEFHEELAEKILETELIRQTFGHRLVDFLGISEATYEKFIDLCKADDEQVTLIPLPRNRNVKEEVYDLLKSVYSYQIRKTAKIIQFRNRKMHRQLNKEELFQKNSTEIRNFTQAFRIELRAKLDTICIIAEEIIEDIEKNLPEELDGAAINKKFETALQEKGLELRNAEKQILNEACRIFHRTFQNVQELYAEILADGQTNTDKFFHAFFRSAPNGKFQITRMAFSINVIVENEDYDRMYHNEAPEETGGCSFSLCGIPVNMIRNCFEAADIIVHENQHSINHQIFAAANIPPLDISDFISAEAKHEDKILKNIFDAFLERWLDEISAYSKDGSSMDQIKENLSHRAYDYYSKTFDTKTRKSLSRKKRKKLKNYKERYRILLGRMIEGSATRPNPLAIMISQIRDLIANIV